MPIAKPEQVKSEQVKPEQTKPDHIDSQHWEELVISSGVDSELAALNVISLSGNLAYDYLLYSDKLDRLNTGRLSSYWMNRYGHLNLGGWWCNGINLVDGSDSLWGCFKPNKPRTDKDGKTIKYEQPPETIPECFFLKVSSNIWELIAAKAGVSLPENYQDVVEKPLIFWNWVIENNVAVMLTEGVKKTLAGLTAGYVCIGFSGVTLVCRQPKDSEGNKIGKPHLIPQLIPFLGSKRKVIFAFDSDNKRRTIRNVNLQIDKVGKLLQYRSCSVNVASWEHQLGKGLDDILVNCGVGKVDEIYRNCKKFHEWKTAQLKQLTYPPDVELDRKYLLVEDEKGNRKPDFKLSSDWVLLWLKAHKGAGKTSYINHIVSPLVYSGERKVLLVTHRVALGKAICDDLGLQYIDERSEEGHKRHLGLCIDSLLKLNPEDWKGCYLILDEIQQLKWHVLNSKTCRKKRVAILKQFKKLLNIIHQSGGKIIIADADLRDDGIDFIVNQIDDEVKTFGILNNYVRDDKDKWKVYNYADKNPARLVSDLLKKLEAGEKIMLCTSGQKARSTWGTQVIEAHVKKLLPDVKILRIDSLTVGEPGHPAYGALNHFKESIEGYQIVVCSPTIETGVSLDFDYFDCVFGIFQGVQACDSVRQHLSRYRKAVPRYLYISPTGINSNKIGNGATSVKALLAGEYKKDKANVQLLVEMGFEESLEGSFENIYLTHWAICGALINDGFNKYRFQILEDLKAEGHEIINLKKDEEEEYSILPVKETRQETYDTHLEKIEVAADIDDDKLEELDKKATLTQEERYQKDKANLAKTYQIPVDAELARKNDEGWYTEIKRHYLINNFDSSLPRQDKNYINYAQKNGDGHRAIWDDNQKLMASKIASLVNICRIKEVLAANGLHEYHPLAVEAGNAVRKNMGDLKLFICDFHDPKEAQPSNMFILRRLVGLIGYKLPQLGQITVEVQKEGKTAKKRVRVHGLAAPDFEVTVYTDKKGNQQEKLALDANGAAIPIPDGREAVFTAWQAKEALEIAKEQEILAQFKIPSELSHVMSKDIQSQDYSGTRRWFEDALVVAINSNDYWEAVKVVEKLEASIARADNFGFLTEDKAIHNRALQDILQNVIGANFESIKALQIAQSKWHEGHRQLLKFDNTVATEESEKHLVEPKPKQSRNSERILIRDIHQEDAEFSVKFQFVQHLINSKNLDDAKEVIEGYGIKLREHIKLWAKALEDVLLRDAALDMLASC
ncbi:MULTISPECIES: plasmid replication protein, CyRepA1 family [Anabaena]|uniref:plasmid replication protein, CyRepA1 family n=1 Tax=Anabaena TaxID=1163 RepID=UPI0002F38256|nr:MULTISPECIES: plasmid replication protein, CyRepA1 family [Anabaena]MBY5284252.1 DUF3854 domain-containing protein [Anabaena sp. CCAP 1446/1C]MBY5310623.1 DUF3854 domain-containing protein [Anabaena sp. CCAP 1446/1C]MCM2405968.1 DUF3854 domain-containing protein [Anabaena sp. CCAP 1446/1C]